MDAGSLAGDSERRADPDGLDYPFGYFGIKLASPAGHEFTIG
jgi:hypothetical protein